MRRPSGDESRCVSPQRLLLPSFQPQSRNEHTCIRRFLCRAAPKEAVSALAWRVCRPGSKAGWPPGLQNPSVCPAASWHLGALSRARHTNSLPRFCPAAASKALRAGRDRDTRYLVPLHCAWAHSRILLVPIVTGGNENNDQAHALRGSCLRPEILISSLPMVYALRANPPRRDLFPNNPRSLPRFVRRMTRGRHLQFSPPE